MSWTATVDALLNWHGDDGPFPAVRIACNLVPAR